MLLNFVLLVASSLPLQSKCLSKDNYDSLTNIYLIACINFVVCNFAVDDTFKLKKTLGWKTQKPKKLRHPFIIKNMNIITGIC